MIMRYDDIKKTIPADEVLDHVMSLHTRDEDFEEGDLEERILRAGPYTLRRIKLDEIDSPWDSDPDVVDKYAKRRDPPAIVVDSELTIIDGTHRYEAWKQKGGFSIRAYIGANSQFASS